MDWLDPLAVQEILMGLLQSHSSKASILWYSVFLWSNSTSIHDYWKNHSFDQMDLCQQSDVSIFQYAVRFVIAYLSGSKCLLVSWLLSPSTVILESKKVKSVTASTFPPSVVMGPDAMVLGFRMLSFRPVFFTLLFHPHQNAPQYLFAFCYQSGVICTSEVDGISPSNLDSSLRFIQPGISHDVLCI